VNDMGWNLGINIAGHGASITLSHDGELILFLKEERVTRKKRDHDLPLISLKYVKEYTNNLDKIYFANCTEKIINRILLHLEKLGIKESYNYDAPASVSYHHLNHASCGYYSSGYDEAICLVVDGWGKYENTSNLFQSDLEPFDLYETCSIFHVKNGQFKLEKKYVNFDPHRYDTLEDKYVSLNQFSNDINLNKAIVNNVLDIGIVYEIITKFIGFGQDECGKTMGLSAYGEPDDEIPPILVGDNLDVNMNLFTASSILNDVSYPQLQRFFSLRKKSNLAYAVQKALEQKIIQRMDMIVNNYNCKNIVLSGGVFYNVVVNSILLKKYPDYNFYVDPLCDDSGHSYGMLMKDANLQTCKLKDLYLGPKYNLVDLKERIYKSASKFQNK
jgi:carbamoyltransferase